MYINTISSTVSVYYDDMSSLDIYSMDCTIFMSVKAVIHEQSLGILIIYF